MYNISDVDRNFVISTGMKRDDIRFFDARNDPFRLYGLMFENGRFCRMTNSAAKNVSDAVFRLNRNTAGGRVRFVTDSEYVAISAKMDNIGRMSHFSLTGSAGFDLQFYQCAFERDLPVCFTSHALFLYILLPPLTRRAAGIVFEHTAERY